MFVDKSAEKYIEEFSSPLPEVLEWLEKETHLSTNHGRMISGPVIGRFLIHLSKSISPLRILEVGTFTGYSAICLAQGLQDKGVLDILEINDELRYIIEEGFRRAGIGGRTNLMIGNALDLLAGLQDNVYDLVYIDGNKREYCRYYELLMPLVRKGGYIVADNVLWSGKVYSPEDNRDAQTSELLRFNRMVKEDPRADNYILPVRDGLNVIKKLV